VLIASQNETPWLGSQAAFLKPVYPDWTLFAVCPKVCPFKAAASRWASLFFFLVGLEFELRTILLESNVSPFYSGYFGDGVVQNKVRLALNHDFPDLSLPSR
jgi:hypothetical protein